MSSATGTEVGEESVIVTETIYHVTFFTVTCYFKLLGYLAAIRRGLVAPLGHRLWAYYCARRALGEEAVDMPRSTLDFIITCLLCFVDIKSQGNGAFPFTIHPRAITFSLTSLLVYGFASAAEHVMSAAGLNRSSIYAVVANLGRIASLCILVASLASLFYL